MAAAAANHIALLAFGIAMVVVPPCGAIEMQLVASDGTPLAGLGVVLNRIDRAAGQRLSLFQTAHDGTFRWSNLASGRYEIRPWAEDFVFDPVELDIEPRGRAVDLRVVANARAFRLGDGDVRGPEIAAAPIPKGTTDGGCGFEALAAGRYLIELLRDAQVLGSTIVEVVEGRTTYLRP